ncbi:MAG: glycerol-3-phosphate acyltransferase, partial [Faecousia sp.]
MKVFLFISAAVVAYLIGGVNPAIVLSNRIYHQDIRQLGSGNPGFTN